MFKDCLIDGDLSRTVPVEGLPSLGTQGFVRTRDALEHWISAGGGDDTTAKEADRCSNGGRASERCAHLSVEIGAKDYSLAAEASSGASAREWVPAVRAAAAVAIAVSMKFNTATADSAARCAMPRSARMGVPLSER